MSLMVRIGSSDAQWAMKSTSPAPRRFATISRAAVRIWYVGLDSPERHLARIRARVQHGGHDIPEADVRRRFDQSRLQLIDLLPHLAELRVYDNSLEASPHGGQAPRPRLVLHWVRTQRPDGEQAAAGLLRCPASPVPSRASMPSTPPRRAPRS